MLRNQRRKYMILQLRLSTVDRSGPRWFRGRLGWEGVYRILKNDGYNVSIVQNPTSHWPTTSLPPSASCRAGQSPVILVGHSYGGVVITEAGNDPKVVGARLHRRVCAGQGRVGRRTDQGPTARCAGAADSAAAGRLPLSRQGEVRRVLRRRRERRTGAFMADSQVPWGVGALGGAVSEPAWKNKPSWYLVATDDKMIPPPAQRLMSSAPARRWSRCRAVTRSTCRSPSAVAALIKAAAESIGKAPN